MCCNENSEGIKKWEKCRAFYRAVLLCVQILTSNEFFLEVVDQSVRRYSSVVNRVKEAGSLCSCVRMSVVFSACLLVFVRASVCSRVSRFE